MSGKHLKEILERTREGNHSFGFQKPELEPLSWPILIVIGRSELCAETVRSKLSATHFDSEYPFPIAAVASAGISNRGCIFSRSREIPQIHTRDIKITLTI